LLPRRPKQPAITLLYVLEFISKVIQKRLLCGLLVPPDECIGATRNLNFACKEMAKIETIPAG
jgi:hypothetical protein